MGVKSKGALAFHLKSFHPVSRTYHCLVCESAFNNAADLASHSWSIHSRKKVSCKHFSYKTTSKARMWTHVHTHTSGLCCKKCGQLYLNFTSLHEHSKLYGKRMPCICSVCNKQFATIHSLRIHVKGIHGGSYRCVYGESFFSPAIQSCQKQKCQCKTWNLSVLVLLLL